MALHQMTAHELSRQIRARTLSSEEVCKAYLDRIAALDDQLGAFLDVQPEQVLSRAREIDNAMSKGADPGPLAGVPIALKDNMVARNAATTCGSKILTGYRPPYNSHVADRLEAQGAILLGKTNMDEFAMGSSTEHSAYFPARNPWDLSRAPGGSSGGSAVAVAADLCAAALGSDTGGSIRQPAAFCGVTGLKPTYGRVSRYGLVAFASSFDQIGPITKDVKDCALLLQSIAGHDPHDSTSVDKAVPDYLASLNRDIKGLRFGIPKEYFIPGMQSPVRDAVEQAIGLLVSLGAEALEISLKHTEYATASYYIVANAEASANLARYDGVRFGFRADGAKELMTLYRKTRAEGFGREVKRRIMLGTYVLSSGYYDAYYLKAQKVRSLICHDFREAFKTVDAIVTPTSPTTAFPIGERLNDPLEMYLADICTIPCNMAGLPGLSLNCGFDPDGLPIGMQLIGRAFDEATLLRIGRAFQSETEWHLSHPLEQPETGAS